MISNERGWKKYPQTGELGEKKPFAKQYRKKERDNGHNSDISNDNQNPDTKMYGFLRLPVFECPVFRDSKGTELLNTK